VVYDRAGNATLLRPGTQEHERLVALAKEVVALWSEPDGPEG
jgi:hypothetical protein